MLLSGAGLPDTDLYIVETGTLQVTMRQGASTQKIEVQAGAMFGETGFIFGLPNRIVSASSITEESRAWKLER